VRLFDVAAALTITLGVASSAPASIDVPGMTQWAQSTASRASCRTVDLAILAYVAERDTTPTVLGDIAPYVRGDISAYTIDHGTAVGPGCGTGPAAP
jgi:hypothetical protein